MKTALALAALFLSGCIPQSQYEFQRNSMKESCDLYSWNNLSGLTFCKKDNQLIIGEYEENGKTYFKDAHGDIYIVIDGIRILIVDKLPLKREAGRMVYKNGIIYISNGVDWIPIQEDE